MYKTTPDRSRGLYYATQKKLGVGYVLWTFAE